MDEKRVKSAEKEDRISDLPDFLIHHILSSLPSTKQAIQTGVLSKRWRNQWTRVPVIIFDPTGMSDEHFFTFMDNAISFYDYFSSGIKKFHIKYHSYFKVDPRFDSRISFATRKNVEDLSLINRCVSHRYFLPENVFNYAYLVEPKVINCNFMPNGSVNWKILKVLNVVLCGFTGKAFESILSGSPLLESVSLVCCRGFRQLVVASKSLKRLVLEDVRKYDLVFSCPNLEQLKVTGRRFSISNQAIESVLSGCPLLNSLELCWCNGFDQLVINSKVLRRLVLKELKVSVIEISGPNLEKLELRNLDCIKTFKMMDVTSSVSAAIDWGKAFVDSKKFVSSIMFAVP